MSIFTTEHAARLMNKMKAFYGKKYAEQWGDIPAADIADAMVECLQGLSQEDFKRGYMRMQRSTFCPTIPEFRSWCEPKADAWLPLKAAAVDMVVLVNKESASIIKIVDLRPWQ